MVATPANPPLELTTAVVLFSSLGAGYSSLNLLFSYKDLELIEFAPMGRYSQMTVRGVDADVQRYVQSIRESDIVKLNFISRCRQEILDCYFSLTVPILKKSMLVVESEYLGELFAIANLSLEKGFSLVDLRMPRTTASFSYLILSSDQISEAAQLRDELVKRGLLAQLIRELTPEFKDYFEIRK